LWASHAAPGQKSETDDVTRRNEYALTDRPRILIVDDEPDVRTMLTRFFEKNDFVVDSAPDGPAALDLIGATRPDIVLLDSMMPSMSGIEVLQRIRGRYAARLLPVIMVTARTQPEDIVQALGAQANDYVTKPFSLPVLLARVRLRLADRAPEQEIMTPGAPRSARESPAVETARLSSGSLVEGRYLLHEIIGEGRFGIVYRATHEMLRKQVAIKVFRDVDTGDSAKVVELLQEGVVSCRLEHPHAVTVLDFGISKTREAYLVMEFLSGDLLRDVVDREGRIGVDRAVEMALPIALVLMEAHARGVVHRDLKPDNVLLHRRYGQEVVKVLDFGIAGFLEALGGEVQKRDDIVGTPAYMAPEIALQQAVDGRSDVYALGCMLFEILTGRPPYLEPTPVGTVVAHLKQPVPNLDAALPLASRELRRLVGEMLRKKADERPTAAQVAGMLSGIRG
jgi:CheY-like chemotaxis protein